MHVLLCNPIGKLIKLKYIANVYISKSKVCSLFKYGKQTAGDVLNFVLRLGYAGQSQYEIRYIQLFVYRL